MTLLDDLLVLVYILAFVLGTVAVALAVYQLARLVGVPRTGHDTRELAGSVIFRVGALHGLILALVFAQELYQFQAVRDATVREATAVADLYYDIDRYGAPEATREAVRGALGAYVREVVAVEWPRLGDEGRLSETAWAHRETVYRAVLDLVPETPRQVSLRAHMVENAQQIATLRQSRENAALYALSPLFWMAALIGFVLVVLPYFIYAPTALNLALLSSISGYTGLVLLFIYAFSNPFTMPGELRPLAFERLAEGEIGAAAAPMALPG